jgi:hypothetical protein
MEGMSADFKIMHISVDGSLANPHMLIAVILWAACLAVTTALAIVRSAQSQHKFRLALFVIPVVLCVLTPWMQLQIAWLIQTVVARQMISTTFFYPPPGWLASTTGLMAGTLAGATLLWRNRRHTKRSAG